MDAGRCLIIARFQPFHYGHLNAVEYCYRNYDETIIVVGMASQSHTPENPFTAGERILMIRESLRWAGHDLSRYITVTLPTLEVNRAAIHFVRQYSPPFKSVITLNPIIQRLFMEEGYEVITPPLKERDTYSGSTIRRLILNNDPLWKQLVPPPVVEIIESIGGVERIKMLYSERLPGYYATA
ncbi:MAG: nicotinamide-nucleotide adenylyltransferase [Desulfurococcus sp.]|uniref:nicotinamide-nucleotide adenylyltransferase n=1 Tax=Desulfurococcus sp. TaxID=51678 RepID=UPI003162DDA7